MAARQIKRQRHPAKSFSKSPLSLYFLAPSCLSGYRSIMQNEPNFRKAKPNTTSCTRCHSDRRHATSVPKRRNLLQYCGHLPNRLFGPIHQRIIACIMQNKANVKMGKMTISTATPKAYANEQRTMSNEHYSKQSQSNPIPPSDMPSPNRIPASRRMGSRQFCRYPLKTLEIRVLGQKRRIKRFCEGLWAVRWI